MHHTHAWRVGQVRRKTAATGLASITTTALVELPGMLLGCIATQELLLQCHLFTPSALDQLLNTNHIGQILLADSCNQEMLQQLLCASSCKLGCIPVEDGPSVTVGAGHSSLCTAMQPWSSVSAQFNGSPLTDRLPACHHVLTCSFRCSSILPIPFAISKTGVLVGVLTMLLVAWANDATSCMLIRAAAATGKPTYEALAEWAGGRPWKVSQNSVRWRFCVIPSLLTKHVTAVNAGPAAVPSEALAAQAAAALPECVG